MYCIIPAFMLVILMAGFEGVTCVAYDFVLINVWHVTHVILLHLNLVTAFSECLPAI